MGGGKQEESPSGKRRESRLLMIFRIGRWLTMTEQNHGSSLNSAKRGGTVAIAGKAISILDKSFIISNDIYDLVYDPRDLESFGVTANWMQ